MFAARPFREDRLDVSRPPSPLFYPYGRLTELPVLEAMAPLISLCCYSDAWPTLRLVILPGSGGREKRKAQVPVKDPRVWARAAALLLVMDLRVWARAAAATLPDKARVQARDSVEANHPLLSRA